MIKLDFSETIKAPVERVFEYATDPDTAAEWQDGVIESRKTPGGQTGQGTVLSTVSVNRTVGTRTFTKGEQISCGRCHSNPL